MVYIARRTAPTAATPTDPGYQPVQQRRPPGIFSDWTPLNPDPHDENVEVYSNSEQVELILNDKSLGSQDRHADDSPRTWKVSYKPGTLKAVAKNKGVVVATYELRTAAKAAKIVLASDRMKITSEWDDVSYITASIVDENGILIPGAGDLITFNITGPGFIAAVDSADNSSHESFRASERRAYQGRCFAIIRANAISGRITLTASAPGLKAASINIEAIGGSPGKR